MITCKECGADFDEYLSECPFCGALNYTGAEEQYLEHLEDIQDDLSDMADASAGDYHASLKRSARIMLTTFCCLILAAGLFAGIFFLIRSRTDSADSSEMQKAQLLWRNRYLDTLDEMYASGNYDGIVTFLDEHAGDEGYSPYSWEHLDFIEIYISYQTFLAERENLDQTDLDAMTWCLYDAASVDYAATQDFYSYTAEELVILGEWQEETAAFYRETLGLSDEEIVRMKSEIVSDDELAIPTSKACKKYLKKTFDF